MKTNRTVTNTESNRDSAANELGDMAGKAKAAGQDTMNQLGSTFKEAAGQASDTMDQAKDKAGRAANRTKDDLHSAINSATAAVQSAIEELNHLLAQDSDDPEASKLSAYVQKSAQKVSAAARSMVDHVSEHLEDARSGAGEVAGRVRDRAREAKDNLREYGEHAADAFSSSAKASFASLDRTVRDHPVGAVLTAVGIGMVLGMWKRK